MDGTMDPYHLTHTIHGLQSPSGRSFNLPSAKGHPLFYIDVYAAVGLGSAFVGVLSAIVQYTGALRASRVLFMQLLVSVVRATMRWHDTTPQGILSLDLFYHCTYHCLIRSHAQSLQQGEKSN